MTLTPGVAKRTAPQEDWGSGQLRTLWLQVKATGWQEAVRPEARHDLGGKPSPDPHLRLAAGPRPLLSPEGWALPELLSEGGCLAAVWAGGNVVCGKPSISRVSPTPEIESLVAGLAAGWGGSGPEHPQCLASLPFLDTKEAGFEMHREGGGRATAISREGPRAVAAERGQFEELLFREG